MPKFSDERIAAILSGRRRIGKFMFPGSDKIEIGVRLLSDEEIDTARFNSQFYLEKRCKSIDMTLANFIQVDPEALDREHMRQILFLAIVDPDSNPDNPEGFFGKDEEVRRLDSVMIQQLWEIYSDWQEVVNPRYKLTSDEVKELVDTIKKEQTAKVILAHFDRSTLTNLAHFLGNELATLQTGKSTTISN
jgi:hypothetical protein